jgi:hypothetical protein
MVTFFVESDEWLFRPIMRCFLKITLQAGKWEEREDRAATR